MKIAILIVIKFLFISALFLISNGNLHLGDSDEREIFMDAYSQWLGNVANQGLEIMGYIVDSQWLPKDNFGEVN